MKISPVFPLGGNESPEEIPKLVFAVFLLFRPVPPLVTGTLPVNEIVVPDTEILSEPV